jgi:hypothetical protein
LPTRLSRFLALTNDRVCGFPKRNKTPLSESQTINGRVEIARFILPRAVEAAGRLQA